MFLAWPEGLPGDLLEDDLELLEVGVELLKLGRHHVQSTRVDVVMHLWNKIIS